MIDDLTRSVVKARQWLKDHPKEQDKPTQEQIADAIGQLFLVSARHKEIRELVQKNVDILSAALRDAQAEVSSIMKELRGLTPGGSEFQTAKECLAYIREKRSADWKIIKESKAEVAREQLAHEAIATLCFASGVSTDDGTSLSAVKNLVAEVDRLRGIVEADTDAMLRLKDEKMPTYHDCTGNMWTESP